MMRNLKNTNLFFLLSILMGCSTTQTTKLSAENSATKIAGSTLSRYELKNGLKIFVLSMHDAPTFSYQIWLNTGSGAEIPNPNLKHAGMAHLFEHLMFPRKHENFVKAAGGVGFNAETWYDYTRYFASYPAASLEEAMRLESLRFKKNDLTEEFFKSELGAAFSELKIQLDNPQLWTLIKATELAYPDSPYRETTIGDEKLLTKFTIDQARYFFKTYYSPNNFNFVIVGDVDPNKTKNIIEKYFGDMKPAEIPKEVSKIPPLRKKQTHATFKHPLLNAPLLHLSFEVTHQAHADVAALEMIPYLLLYRQTAWLEEHLVDKGLATQVSGDMEFLRHTGFFNVDVNLTDVTKLSAAKKEISKAFSRLLKGDFTQKELDACKNLALLNAYSSQVKNEQLAYSIGWNLVSTGRPETTFEVDEKIKSLTVSDIVRVANIYLSPDKKNEFLTLPSKGKKL